MRKSTVVIIITLGVAAISIGALLRYSFGNNIHGTPTTAATSQSGNVPRPRSSIGNPSSVSQDTTLQISAKDYKTSGVYSTLMISIPQSAFASPTEVKISAVPPMPCGNLSGAYLLLPQGQKLLAPATVSITYTDMAVANHEKCYSDFKEVNLTLAYYDNTLYKYVPLQSTFNPSMKTVSGCISQFYSGGIMVVPASLIH